MAYTTAEIIAQAQKFLVDGDDDAYVDDTLSYLNEAQRRFATETHCCQAVVDLDVTDETIAFSTIAAAVSGAEEVNYIAKVRLNSGTQYSFLPKAHVSEMKDLPVVATTTPTRYSVFADKIYFDLHPTADIDFDITVFCSYTPSDLAAGENLVIPSQWAQAIVHYIVYCCRVADRDTGLANGAFTEYEAIRAQAAAFYLAQAGR